MVVTNNHIFLSIVTIIKTMHKGFKGCEITYGVDCFSIFVNLHSPSINNNSLVIQGPNESSIFHPSIPSFNPIPFNIVI